MKPGRRAVGIAESYRAESSTLAAAVVRADRVVEDFRFDTCMVGGSDATETVQRLWDGLDRPDVRYLFLAGVAPAWYNLLDLEALEAHIDRPVVAVATEDSPGLEDALREAFEGPGLDRRLDRYAALPPRRPLSIGDVTVYVRSVGIEETAADRVVRAFTHADRPEPLRVAKRAARAADAFRRSRSSVDG